MTHHEPEVYSSEKTFGGGAGQSSKRNTKSPRYAKEVLINAEIYLVVMPVTSHRGGAGNVANADLK
jgi:hypothetical protein